MTTKQTVTVNGMKEINAKLATAALTAIIEMPTFKESKIDFASEGNDGMFYASFTKSERLDVDCYGNVSEQESYEISVYDVLGGDELLTVCVEDGKCYIGDEKTELQNVSAEAVNAMLTFKGSEGDQMVSACEEVAFNPMGTASSEFGELIEESIRVFQLIQSDEISPDEKVDYIERHFELEGRRKELRERM